MAQLLAIEWDAREARLAVATVRGREPIIEHAFAVALGHRDGDSTSELSVGEQIAEELRRRGIGRIETLVAVGRANIELKQLNSPPAPAAELPELVRFQALRQFTTIGEDWPLDFVPLDTAEVDSISVLAAAISPELVQHIGNTCEAAGLTPKRLVLRPFAAASLLRRHDRGVRQPCRLMVDLLTEEADLTVLDGQHLLLTRTVRLHSPEDDEAQARGLLSEIRRTIAAANNQLGGRRVDKVILCGDGSDHATIKSLVEHELALPTELFDPFSELREGTIARPDRPEHAGRFAPLLGLLFDEATATPHSIDFLHPRKKPEPRNVRRSGILIASTFAVLGIAAAFLVWLQLSSLDEDIAHLKARSSELKSEVTAADKLRKDETAIQDFLNHNINWLDELEQLSQRLPPAEDAIVTQLSFAVQPYGGQVRIEGYTREPTGFQDIENRLRVADRVVNSGQKTNEPKREKHHFGFAEELKIPPIGGATKDAGGTGSRSRASRADAAQPNRTATTGSMKGS